MVLMLSLNGYFSVKKEDKINQLKTEIQEKAEQLKKLNLHVDKSNVCSDLYNKVVLEKAELNKQLQELENSSVLGKIKKILPKKKTLISDYFKK